jgi:hypothetical protein
VGEDGVWVSLDKVWEGCATAAVGLVEAGRVVFLHELVLQPQPPFIPHGLVGLAGGPLQPTACLQVQVLAATALPAALPACQPSLRAELGDL